MKWNFIVYSVYCIYSFNNSLILLYSIDIVYIKKKWFLKLIRAPYQKTLHLKKKFKKHVLIKRITCIYDVYGCKKLFAKSQLFIISALVANLISRFRMSEWPIGARMIQFTMNDVPSSAQAGPTIPRILYIHNITYMVVGDLLVAHWLDLKELQNTFYQRNQRLLIFFGGPG